MSVLRTRLDTGSPAFAANREAMLAKLAEIGAQHATAIAGGGPKYTDRHHQRGKLLARERIELLLDEDAPFLELSPLAAYGSTYPVGNLVCIRRACQVGNSQRQIDRIRGGESRNRRGTPVHDELRRGDHCGLYSCTSVSSLMQSRRGRDRELITRPTGVNATLPPIGQFA